jgi:predicted lipoprotein with Yx(FWY)xxD motif
MARVGGVVEIILVDERGLPLYIYESDTSTRSMVTGELAALWPPLVASAPRASGASGSLAVVTTGHGRQVTYDGHFLYSCAQDRPGQVTGQGVQDFSVATPGMAPNQSAAASTDSEAAPSRASAGYGY